MNMNNRMEVFPSNIVASGMNLKKESYFEIEMAEKEAPKVSF